MNEINKLIKKFKFNINLNIFINFFIDFSLLYFVLATALTAVANLYYIKYFDKMLLIEGIIMLLVLLAVVFRKRKSEKYAAIYIDSMGFDSRFITILESDSSIIKDYIIEETLELIIKQKIKYEMAVNRRWRILILVTCLFFTFYYFTIDVRSTVKEQYQTNNPVIKQIEEVENKLDEYLNTTKSKVEDKKYLSKELDSLKKDLNLKDFKKMEKNVKLLSKKIQHVNKSNNKELKKKIMDEMGLGSNIEDMDMELLKEALKNIDMEQLNEKLKEMLENMDPEELEKFMENLQASISEGDMNKLMESLENLEGLSQSSLNNLNTSMDNLGKLVSSQNNSNQTNGQNTVSGANINANVKGNNGSKGDNGNGGSPSVGGNPNGMVNGGPNGYSPNGTSPPKSGEMDEIYDANGNLDMRDVTSKGDKNLTFTILRNILGDEVLNYDEEINRIGEMEIEKLETKEIPDEYKESIRNYFNSIRE